MTACTVTDNTSFVGAGLHNAGRATVTDSTFLNNHSTNSGGAIANLLGDLAVSGSTLAGNNGGLYGGGIVMADGHLSLTNSTVSGNVVERQGGGIYYNSGLMELTSSTVVFNRTTRSFTLDEWGGGGVYAEPGRVLVRNTIVAGNVTAQDGPDVLGAVLSLGYNLVSRTDFSSGWAATDRTGTADAPLDPRLGPLQDHGGPTPTHALLVGSPAVGAGDPAAVASLDQRGSVRGGFAGSSTDIGAFEAGDVAQFRLLAPAAVGAGEPFDLTVVALDRWGNVASTYTGTVHFSSTDLFALLPEDYTFAGDDAGSHTFAATLQTPGHQSLAADDVASTSVRAAVGVDVGGGTGPGEFVGFLADVLARTDRLREARADAGAAPGAAQLPSPAAW
jgi:hypothetical protein